MTSAKKKAWGVKKARAAAGADDVELEEEEGQHCLPALLPAGRPNITEEPISAPPPPLCRLFVLLPVFWRLGTVGFRTTDYSCTVTHNVAHTLLFITYSAHPSAIV